jgi:hypothetical protein
MKSAPGLATKTLPSWSLINYAFTARRFYRTHGYLPRLPSNQSATLNDYIYYRMIRGGWTDIERRATDKEIAKSVASELCPTLKTARIVRTMDHTKMTEAEFREEISPFYGQRVVAKSTHRCGDIVFLQDRPDDAAVTALYRTRGWNGAPLRLAKRAAATNKHSKPGLAVVITFDRKQQCRVQVQSAYFEAVSAPWADSSLPPRCSRGYSGENGVSSEIVSRAGIARLRDSIGRSGRRGHNPCLRNLADQMHRISVPNSNRT